MLPSVAESSRPPGSCNSHIYFSMHENLLILKLFEISVLTLGSVFKWTTKYSLFIFSYNSIFTLGALHLTIFSGYYFKERERNFIKTAFLFNLYRRLKMLNKTPICYRLQISTVTFYSRWMKYLDCTHTAEFIQCKLWLLNKHGVV